MGRRGRSASADRGTRRGRHDAAEGIGAGALAGALIGLVFGLFGLVDPLVSGRSPSASAPWCWGWAGFAWCGAFVVVDALVWISIGGA